MLFPTVMRKQFVALLVASGYASAWSVGQLADTSSGSVQGHTAPNTNGVSEYLGIPYAKSPTGQLRFAPPVAASRSSTVLNGSSIVTCPANSIYGPAGLSKPAFPYVDQVNFGQNGKYLQNLIGNSAPFHLNEDCLQLHVWTKPQTGEKKKAVLVFFYGGGFSFGSSEDPRYTGKFLADSQDVVVVTLNYRMNIFGFPSAPNTRQNLGLLDQRLAVEWVRDNIANFGGDPSRIVLFGQSAGGAAQDYYAQAWTKDPIVSGFIPESGNIASGGASKLDSTAWYKATKAVGCGDQNSNQDSVLKCMRSKPFTDILAAIQGQPGLGSVLASGQFGVVADEITAFSDAPNRFKTGNYIKVPILVGTTDNEAGVAQTVVHALSGGPAPQLVLDFVNINSFECSAGKRAQYSTMNKVKTYRYRWFGYWPNMALGLGFDASTAYHEAELSTVFGTSELFGGSNTAAQRAIQNFTMQSWAAFAKDPVNGLAKLGWPEYTAAKPSLMRLAYNNSAAPSVIDARRYDSECLLTSATSAADAVLTLLQTNTRGVPA